MSDYHSRAKAISADLNELEMDMYDDEDVYQAWCMLSEAGSLLEDAITELPREATDG